MKNTPVFVRAVMRFPSAGGSSGVSAMGRTSTGGVGAIPPEADAPAIAGDIVPGAISATCGRRIDLVQAAVLFQRPVARALVLRGDAEAGDHDAQD